MLEALLFSGFALLVLRCTAAVRHTENNIKSVETLAADVHTKLIKD